jgi:hypothetical protein
MVINVGKKVFGGRWFTAYLKALSCHLPGEIDKIYEKP